MSLHPSSPLFYIILTRERLVLLVVSLHPSSPLFNIVQTRERMVLLVVSLHPSSPLFNIVPTRERLVLLVVSLHPSSLLFDTVLTRERLLQQRALEDMIHRLVCFFSLARGMIILCVFLLFMLCFSVVHLCTQNGRYNLKQYGNYQIRQEH